jgi:hypothetical protein
MCLVEIIVKSVQTLGYSIVGSDFEKSSCIVALCRQVGHIQVEIQKYRLWRWQLCYMVKMLTKTLKQKIVFKIIYYGYILNHVNKYDKTNVINKAV